MIDGIAFGVTAAALLLQQPADTIRVPDEVACATCEIRVREVARLGSDRGDELLTDMMGSAVVRDHEGGYWLYSYRIRDRLWRFSPDGTARLLGTSGQGPGELEVVWTMTLLPDGRIAVLDGYDPRVEIFTSDGRFSDSRRFPAGSGVDAIEWVGGDTLVASSTWMGDGGLGTPLMLYSLQEGRAIAPFGLTPETYDRRTAFQLNRRFLSHREGTVAALHMWGYAVDLLNLGENRLVRSIRRESEWFPPEHPTYEIMATVDPDRRPISSGAGVRCLPDGTILTLVRRARSEWREGYEGSRVNREGGRSPTSYALTYETVIEHLDPVRGRVLARAVVAGYPLAFVSGALQLAVLHDEQIIPTIQILDVEVVR